MSHAVAHVHRHQVAGEASGERCHHGRVRKSPPAPTTEGVSRPTPRPLNPDTVARWRETGRLSAADVAAILAERNPADPHPIASLIARLRAVS